MSDVYTPPEVWTFDPENGGQFAGVNRPTAGAREEKVLPVGQHPFQLYSLGTPNGMKVGVMFEELLEAGFSEAEYDAWQIKIFESDQFWSGFVEINPNSKIPALVDRSGPEPFRVFESGAILLHLAEKFDYLLPKTNPARAETFSWLMWQMGSAPGRPWAAGNRTSRPGGPGSHRFRTPGTAAGPNGRAAPGSCCSD